MVIRISQEQLAKLTQREKYNYINRLHQIIIKHSPALRHDNELMTRLKDADSFVEEHCFKNEQVKTDFLIMNTFEPDFYKNEAMKNWLLNGTESVEDEYVKYQQIRENLMQRIFGGVND